MATLTLDAIFGEVGRTRDHTSTDVSGIALAADGSQLYITIHAGRDGGLAMRLSGDQIDRFCHLLATAVFAINRASVLGGQGGEALQ
ncbi:hypothetical protein [Sphingomonas sp. CCH15-F11]|uniref:hypothetical protein n=1 Tax=Sphingomonas sp. CCH15-F11 TaxID=1768785 RepID=UPI00082D9705|nr:hypothetical protein [Sphingomonas sp. CCH15-F11]